MIFLLWACSGSGTDTSQDTPDSDGVVDHTIDWSAQVQEGWFAFYSPDYVVPAYTDQTMCYFDTYDGPDVAVPWAAFYQNMEFGHHVVLMSSLAEEEDWPDGTIADCTDTNADIMIDSRPFLFAGGDSTDLENPEMSLPDGMAIKLKSGTRFVIQSHHINYTDTPIRVNDVVFLEQAALETVDTFAAPWVHTSTDFIVPAGESMSLDVTCTFDQDVHLLSLLGHLHEWGASYRVVHNRLDGSSETIYDLPTWDVVFRDSPPTNTYAPGEMPVLAGESFTTTCAWNNDTSAPLAFPIEMCATVGFAYPLTVAIVCSPD